LSKKKDIFKILRKFAYFLKIRFVYFIECQNISNLQKIMFCGKNILDFYVLCVSFVGKTECFFESLKYVIILLVYVRKNLYLCKTVKKQILSTVKDRNELVTSVLL
jgi:hypothetical protein